MPLGATRELVLWPQTECHAIGWLAGGKSRNKSWNGASPTLVRVFRRSRYDKVVFTLIVRGNDRATCLFHDRLKNQGPDPCILLNEGNVRAAEAAYLVSRRRASCTLYLCYMYYYGFIGVVRQNEAAQKRGKIYLHTRRNCQP